MQVGLYYWRGRVLPLLRSESGDYIVRVPSELVWRWLQDKRKGLLTQVKG
jgi:hypothetical protein